MAKSLQSLPFQIADREAQITDLEAEVSILTEESQRLADELHSWKNIAKTKADEAAAVTAQRDAAVEVLRAVEWFGGLGDVCPLCRQRKQKGHDATDCKLAAVLEAHK